MDFAGTRLMPTYQYRCQDCGDKIEKLQPHAEMLKDAERLRCAKCEGAGTRAVRRHWPRHEQAVSCTACDGSGECQLCHGKGTLDPPRADPLSR